MTVSVNVLRKGNAIKLSLDDQQIENLDNVDGAKFSLVKGQLQIELLVGQYVAKRYAMAIEKTLLALIARQPVINIDINTQHDEYSMLCINELCLRG